MAYAQRYHIPFVSRLGTTYRVEILEDGYTGDSVELTGAPSPITTAETGSDELFLPVREQSGYIRIVADSDTWRDLVPEYNGQYMVRLRDVASGGIVWIGYMKAEALTGGLWEGMKELEYPIFCPLSFLSTKVYEFTNSTSTIVSTRQLLKDILDACGVPWARVYVSNTMYNKDNLDSRFSKLNFVTTETKPAWTNGVAKWTCEKTYLDVLNDICQYWGLTAKVRGLDVFFVAEDMDVDMDMWDYSDFHDSSVVPVTVPKQEAELDGLSYIGTGHSVEVVPAVQTVTVDSSVNEGTTRSVIDASDLKDLPYDDPVPYQKINGIRYSLADLVGNAQTWERYVGNLDVYHKGWSSAPSAPVLIAQYAQWEEGKDTGRLNWQTYLLPWLNLSPVAGSISDNLLFSLRTAETVIVPGDVVLAISAEALTSPTPARSDFPVNESGGSYTPTCYAKMYVKIGDKYWSSSGWTTTPTSLSVYLDKESIFTTRSLVTDNHSGASGYCIDSSVVEGRLEIGFLLGASVPSGKSLVLNNFKVGLYASINKYKNEDNTSYKVSEVASARGIGETGLSVAFISGTKNKYGRSQLYTGSGAFFNEDYFYVGGVLYNNLRPEQALCKRMAVAYGRSRARLEAYMERQQVSTKNENFQVLPYVITTADPTKWGTNTTNTHGCVRVVPGQKMEVHNVGSANNVWYAFVTSSQSSSGGSVPLVPGTSSQLVRAGERAIATVPEGATYFIFNHNSSTYKSELYEIHEIDYPVSRFSDSSGVRYLPQGVETDWAEDSNRLALMETDTQNNS